MCRETQTQNKRRKEEEKERKRERKKRRGRRSSKASEHIDKGKSFKETKEDQVKAFATKPDHKNLIPNTLHG